MKSLPLQKRDICRTGLSLGEIIAVTFGSSIALFTIIGLIMAWRIKIRQKRAPTRVYAVSDEFYQTRLTKCPLAMTESAMGGLSNYSRLPFKPSPNMQPPPQSSRSTSDIFRTLSRRRVVRKRWTNSGDFHRPHANRRKSQNKPSYEDCLTPKQPEKEYHKATFEFQNHRLHYQPQQMSQFDGKTAIFQLRIEGIGGRDVELPPWGRGWRVPDTYHQIRPERLGVPIHPYNKALSQIRRQSGARRPRYTHEENADEEEREVVEIS